MVTEVRELKRFIEKRDLKKLKVAKDLNITYRWLYSILHGANPGPELSKKINEYVVSG